MPFFGGGGSGGAAVDLASPSAIGSTTPNTGAFTTLSASSTLSVTSKGTIEGITIGKGGGSQSESLAIGFEALNGNNTGTGNGQNTAFGYQALKANTTGNRNIAIGGGAIAQATSRTGNVAVGWDALQNPSADQITAIGLQAMKGAGAAGDSVAVGYNANYFCSGARNTMIGTQASQSQTSGTDNVSVGYQAGFNNNTNPNTTGSDNVFIGSRASGSASTNSNQICIGKDVISDGANTIRIGNSSHISTALGGSTASLRTQFAVPAFSAVFWSGTTTNATPSILNLGGTATNRFTIAANTAVLADISIIARRTDTVDKWFSSRRMVAIRRNNANGTAIIGSVQTIGTDQTEGSPSWSVAITADDTNEALQVEVTGAASETVSWRINAIYQVV